MKERKRAFTLLELLVASALFAYFTMVLMELNVLSSRHILRIAGRSQVCTDAKLAYNYLAQDLREAQNVTWNGASELLTIERSDSSTYEYYVDGDALIRSLYGSGDGLTVADGVSGWTARSSTFALDVDLKIRSGSVERRIRLHRSFPQS